jgi:L-2-hydroxyglutarate oxidase LhgO
VARPPRARKYTKRASSRYPWKVARERYTCRVRCTSSEEAATTASIVATMAKRPHGRKSRSIERTDMRKLVVPSVRLSSWGIHQSHAE